MIEKLMNPVGLGIVGAGAIVKTILPLLKTRPEVRLIGVTDINTNAAQSLCEETPELQAVPDLDSLLKNPKIDLLYLATPPHLHEEQIQTILKSGKSVIGEKPWVLHAPEARSIAMLAQMHPHAVVASCASRFRFIPATQATERLLRDKALGKLRSIKITATLNLPQPVTSLPPWKQKAGLAGGGIAADWCVYELDWLVGTLGSEFQPQSITAWLDHWKREGTGLESGYEARIQCASGLIIHLLRRSEIGPRYHQIEIRGEAGGLDLPFSPDVSLKNVQHHFLDENEKNQTTTLPETTPTWQEILVGPMIDAALALTHKKRPASDPESQILVHQCLDALYESAQKNQTISLS